MNIVEVLCIIIIMWVSECVNRCFSMWVCGYFVSVCMWV